MTIFGTIPTPDDVAALQQELRAHVEGLDPDFGQCEQLDQNTRAAWGLYRDVVLRFVDEEPTWIEAISQMDRGHRLQDQLPGWRNKLEAAGCKTSSPEPVRRDPPLTQLGNVAKWGAVALTAILAILVVSNVRSVLK